jgi:hypothetical protein
VAEGGGLLNRYTLLRRIEGSNPSVSAKNQVLLTDHFDLKGPVSALAGPRRTLG